MPANGMYKSRCDIRQKLLNMKKIKQWILYNVIARLCYKYWIKQREKNKDEFGEKLCFCGHTYKCTCSNPGRKLFIQSVKHGTVKIFDKDNGWRNVL